MPIYDTLIYNGLEQQLALPGWGFSRDAGPIQRIGNAKPDTWIATAPVASILGALTFPFEAQVSMWTNRQSADGSANSFSSGEQLFYGWRVRNPIKAKGNNQNFQWEFQGPWYWLQRTQYLQSFKGTTQNWFPGEVVLNTAAYPVLSTPGALYFISLGDQIQAILQYVIDQCVALRGFAPFQYVGRTLLNGAFNLDVNGQAAQAGINTNKAGNIYNQKLPANGLTIDQNLFANFLGSEITRPMSAAESLQKLLEASPRTNISFDYSKSPPMCYVMTVDDVAPQSMPLFTGNQGSAGPSHTALDIQRRDDLIPAGVVIGYRITTSVNGQQEVSYQEDKAGPNGSNNAADPDSGPGVLVHILDLQGSSTSFTSAQMDCEPLAARGGTQATKRAWWAAMRGGNLQKIADSRARFMDASGNATTIPDAKYFYVSAGFDSTGAAVAANQEFTAADYATYTNRVVDGSHHSWMTFPNNSAVLAVKARITAPMTFREFDATSTSQTPDTDQVGNELRRHDGSDQHTGTITLTNAFNTNGQPFTDTTLESAEAGELAIIGPGGIAAYLYNMLKVPQYDGDGEWVEINFSETLSILAPLNLTGGRPEWAAMNAQVQDVEQDWGSKRTRVRVGPAKHLTPEQFLKMLNVWRDRRPWYNPNLRTNNNANQNGEVQMADTTPQINSTEGLENVSKQSVLSYSAQPNGNLPGVIATGIVLDPNKLAFIAAMNAQ